ncbi:TRAP transporter substrate-binding protein [Myxococcota bacterium]|nr:TRAP transporter substrate-binding protein [Myxococcota bacterium]
MSRRAASVAVCIAFVTGLIVSLAVRPSAREVRVEAGAAGPSVRWRLPLAFGSHLPALGDNPLWVAERIAEASGGRIQIEPFEPGEVVPTFSIVDAVRDGKVEAGYTWLGYDQGKLPASVLFGAVPFGFEPWAYAAWWYEAGGRELAEEIYGELGVQPILCGLIGPETAGWFRTQVDGAEDVQGLKIRFAGLGGKVIQRLGASVTLLPGGEIFQALEKGAIDATEYSLPNVDERLGFDRVASFNYFPGWHQPFTAAHLVVGERAWEALDLPDQVLVELACTAGVIRNLSKAEALQGPVLAGFEGKGVVTETLPTDLLAQLRNVSDEILAEEAAADMDFARVLAAQREFGAVYERWKNLAYPRADF